jgi:hypothetical protein
MVWTFCIVEAHGLPNSFARRERDIGRVFLLAFQSALDLNEWTVGLGQFFRARRAVRESFGRVERSEE